MGFNLRRLSSALSLTAMLSAGCTVYSEDHPRRHQDDQPVYRNDDRPVYRNDDQTYHHDAPADPYRPDPYRPDPYHPDPYRQTPPPPPVYHTHDEDWNQDHARDPELDDSWTFLGRRVVDFRGDHDTFKVGSKLGRFRVLKFIVRNGDLDIYNFVITVGDDKYKPDVRQHYDENTASRTIDLPGDRRTVVRVDFTYRSTSRRDGRATVGLYGK